ncbi:hypothetical protein PMI38_00915 [Pseudomonas sp. GM84]|uniref:NAD(P)/FAD-dependent oxidoreductase n=1 Tax=Pseudomonas sp. GM84 TaxID=1144340 RepID=UPI00026F55D7|nr:NAD(P)-binding protein [Pseudomonas sp. GM84]EJN39683.1 hypothetical protein PMI38_00915 [Pseudomonas sp. GM84]
MSDSRKTAEHMGQIAEYPPTKTGMRGNHEGTFSVAHPMGRGKKEFFTDNLRIEERYDLIVVGAGISGLSAAWFHLQAQPDAQILILDLHDDFGGHAKRNEFEHDGRTLITYGGTESFQSPTHLFSDVANGMLKKLGVVLDRFHSAFNRALYPAMGLSRGVFFDQATFGENRLVAGDPSTLVADDLAPDQLNARDWQAFIADFPLPEEDRSALLRLHREPEDYLAGKSPEEKQAHLEKISYLAFLRDLVGVSELASRYFLARSNDFMALSIDAISAYSAYEFGFPGFAGMALPAPSDEAKAEMEEPYIYHFPDGVASLARLLVRDMIPGIAQGGGMDDIVGARFDYSQLDSPTEQAVRLRLSSTVVSVTNRDEGVDVGYSRNGKLHCVNAKRCVLACDNVIIPRILRGLGRAQSAALLSNVRFPLVYAKVLVRNWQSFVNLGVHEIYAPSLPYSRVKLAYPVDLGAHEHARDPQQPMVLHMVHVPCSPGSGLDGRAQAKAGRMKLQGMRLAMMEQQIRSQLQCMLAPGGFDHESDIIDITINRWAHGYAYTFNSLFDNAEESQATLTLARRKLGNVAIAGSDSAWEPYAHAAIDQAWRAINELR